MHKSGFFHKYLKPENIIIGNEIEKICDFGLSSDLRYLLKCI
jgi:serine/threonine protein kinase